MTVPINIIIKEIMEIKLLTNDWINVERKRIDTMNVVPLLRKFGLHKKVYNLINIIISSTKQNRYSRVNVSNKPTKYYNV